MEYTIKVSKVNEAYIHIDANRGILQEISSFFTFFVPGAQFSPKFRAKIWDGNIRLFNVSNQIMYYGLVYHLAQFAKDRSYEVHYEDDVLLKNEFSIKEAVDFADSLDLHSRGSKITARDYQIMAFTKSIRNKRQLILSPTASGKSLIDYLIVRYLEGKNGLIVVPTIALVEQLYTDFRDYSSSNGWNVEKYIHRLHGGYEKATDKPILLTTWQSIYKNGPEFFDRFQYVLAEEAHLFKAVSLISIMTNLANAEYRIGLTGTLDGMKTHKLVLEGLTGPVKRVASTKELIDKGQLSQFNVKCLVLKYPKEYSTEIVKGSYNDEITFLNGHKPRNNFIKNLTLSLKGNTLLLFRFVETHGQILYESIKEKAGNRKVFFVHGATDVETREEVRRIMETETDAIAVASVGVFSTGTNIRNIHNLIASWPSKSKIKTLQSIGRSLRIGDNKDMATLYDIADDLRHNTKENFTIRHFQERVKMYQEESFPYRLYHINLKG